jgi:ubiquinone/menaquinone biosynthesis C-methylase UbiE
MSAQDNQPDWDTIAEKFEIWIPHLAPVGEKLLQALDAQPGDIVLDVASGTGEPALTLARRMGSSLTLVGTDAAEGMVKVAQKKAQQENLPHVHFECMPAEKLTFEDDMFDRVLSRFGVMLFENPLQGLKEMRRVMKPDGRFALAVWSMPEAMPTMYWSYQAFKDKIPEEFHPPVARVTSLGAPGALENALQAAGFTEFSVETHSFDYEFPTFDAFWDAVEASDIMKMQFDALPEEQHRQIRDEVALFAETFVGENGLAIPHKYLLATGQK